jgi:hypothetical protein
MSSGLYILWTAAAILMTARLLSRTFITQAYMFTRGVDVAQDLLFYSCEKVNECLDEFIPASDFDPENIELCETHQLPMDRLVTDERNFPG